MRAAQVCALKRAGKVIGFEAEPFSVDEKGYATHKGGLMEYSAISRFIVVANDKTGTAPCKCTANIPMADLAYMHIKLVNAVETLADIQRKKALLSNAGAEMSEAQKAALQAEMNHPPIITIYEQESKILLSRKDKDGHSLVYSIIFTCDTSRNAPFVLTLKNFYSAIDNKRNGTMTHTGPQFNKSNILFYATEAEMVGVIERMYEFSRDYRNTTFAAQVELMKTLNAKEKLDAKSSSDTAAPDMDGDVGEDEVERPAEEEPTAMPLSQPATSQAVSKNNTPLPARNSSVGEYDPESVY